MSSITKRQQARNEKELNELLHVPGNNQCADCQARNPGWASWSLGIFLCMRCASLHRKLGTHISKVKSLSMDTWTSEQVLNMKQNGNVVANKIYNPRNKRPDIPLDADEVDAAMERYIRKKYQEKSLSDGKPLPPARNNPDVHYSRDEAEAYNSRSPGGSPPPSLPSKKGKFFGFGLRAVSSAYPLSKHDKKNKTSPVEPRVDRAFRIGSESYSTPSAGDSWMSDDDLKRQVTTLQEMGFRNRERNTALLRATNGDIERTIATLVKMDAKDAKSASKRQTPTTTGSTKTDPVNTSFPTESEVVKTQPSSSSTNPFDQIPAGPRSIQGPSFAPAQQSQPTGRSYQSEPQGFRSNDPFDMPTRGQTDQGLMQAFQGMQTSQPLFPHSTGGHPAQAQPQQDLRFQDFMSPPVPAIPQQYGYTTSPVKMVNTNPFFQQGGMSQHIGYDHNASAVHQQPPNQQNNPFFQQQLQQQQRRPSAGSQVNASHNPFGIPPQPQPQQYTQQQAQAQPNLGFAQSLPQQAPQQQQSHRTLDYLQQPQYQQGHTQLQPSSQQRPHIQSNPYAQQQQQPQQYQQQAQQYQQPAQYQPRFQGQPQLLVPQQTGRYDKASIMALYNYPQVAPQQSLSSIPEPSEGQAVTPGREMDAQKRSATMPVSSMHSAGGRANRNPFMNNTSSATSIPIAQAPAGGGFMGYHASAESVQINNLQNGRHSPDAFANLSARYIR